MPNISKCLGKLPVGFVLCSTLFFVGCGSGANLSGVVPAMGVVTYKGAPVEGATVSFLPDTSVTSSTEQRPATAKTDASGKFAMMTLQPKDGAFPGTYKVVIAKRIPEKVYTQEELQAFFRQGKPTPIPKETNELPEQYGDLKTTPLDITLEAKGNRSIVFDLSD